MRPQYPVTSMQLTMCLVIISTGPQCTMCASVVRKASQGILGTDTTKIMRQIDPVFSPVDHGMVGGAEEKPGEYGSGKNYLANKGLVCLSSARQGLSFAA